MDAVAQILNVIVKLSALVFVVASMFAMGASLTIPQIIQPLKNIKLLIMALIANFIVVPIIAILLVKMFRQRSASSQSAPGRCGPSGLQSPIDP